jgi:hypothetical protein
MLVLASVIAMQHHLALQSLLEAQETTMAVTEIPMGRRLAAASRHAKIVNASLSLQIETVTAAAAAPPLVEGTTILGSAGQVSVPILPLLRLALEVTATTEVLVVVIAPVHRVMGQAAAAAIIRIAAATAVVVVPFQEVIAVVVVAAAALPHALVTDHLAAIE